MKLSSPNLLADVAKQRWPVVRILGVCCANGSCGHPSAALTTPASGPRSHLITAGVHAVWWWLQGARAPPKGLLLFGPPGEPATTMSINRCNKQALKLPLPGRPGVYPMSCHISSCKMPILRWLLCAWALCAHSMNACCSKQSRNASHSKHSVVMVVCRQRQDCIA